MASSKAVIRGTVFLCCVSLLLQILGYACPGWLVLSLNLDMLGPLYPGVSGLGRVVTHSAVWYIHVCVHGGDRLFNIKTCSTSSRHDSDTMGLNLIGSLSGLVDVNWLEIGVELTLALAACIGAITLCLLPVCGARLAISTKVLYALASGLMLLSGILILPGVIKVSDAINKARSTIDIIGEFTGHQFLTIQTPWALVLSAVAMVIAYLCCFLFIISACKLNEKTSPSVCPQQSETACQQSSTSPVGQQSSLAHLPLSRLSIDAGRLPPINERPNREVRGQLAPEMDIGPYLVFPTAEGQSRVAYYYSGENHPILDSRPPSYQEIYQVKCTCSRPGAEPRDNNVPTTSTNDHTAQEGRANTA